LEICSSPYFVYREKEEQTQRKTFFPFVPPGFVMEKDARCLLLEEVVRGMTKQTVDDTITMRAM